MDIRDKEKEMHKAVNANLITVSVRLNIFAWARPTPMRSNEAFKVWLRWVFTETFQALPWSLES